MDELTNPVVQLASALQPDIPVIHQFPSDAYAVGDVSWYSRQQSGGAFAIGSVTSSRVDVYHMVIPVAMDHAYMVELYVAWALLMTIVRSNVSAPHTWYRKAMMFHDCNSYIRAVESDNEPTNPLVRALLQACRDLLQRLTPPRHLGSHQTGTFLDTVLDQVDIAAKKVAKRQQPAVGWIANLQPP